MQIDATQFKALVQQLEENRSQLQGALKGLELNQGALREWEARIRWAQAIASYAAAPAGEAVRTPEVWEALREAVKYTDPRLPFRLSVFGNSGVGKGAIVNALVPTRHGKATLSTQSANPVSTTRLRLVPYQISGANSQPPFRWRVTFLTPRRLWKLGTYLLQGKDITLNQAGVALDTHLKGLRKEDTGDSKREEILQQLEQALATAPTHVVKEALKNQNGTLANARSDEIDTQHPLGSLTLTLRAYKEYLTTAANRTYSQDFQENLDPESPKIAKYLLPKPTFEYLTVDYVERMLDASEGGELFGGKNIELEDALGLAHPRDNFFAEDAFREAFAVLIVLTSKDRGLVGDASRYLKNSVQAKKVIIVANRFDEAIRADSDKELTDKVEFQAKLRDDIAQAYSGPQPLRVYYTSATKAQDARTGQGNFDVFLKDLEQFIAKMEEQHFPALDLEFITRKKSDIQAALQGRLDPSQRAWLVQNLSGIPDLLEKIRHMLGSQETIHLRLKFAEDACEQAMTEMAVTYAQQAHQIGLDIPQIRTWGQAGDEATANIQREFRRELVKGLEEARDDMLKAYRQIAEDYSKGPTPLPAEIKQVREEFIRDLRKVMEAVPAGEDVPDPGLGVRVYNLREEDYQANWAWLALSMGNAGKNAQLLRPLMEKLKQLDELIRQKLQDCLPGYPQHEAFWKTYTEEWNDFERRLQGHARSLAVNLCNLSRKPLADIQALRNLDGVLKTLIDEINGKDSWFEKFWVQLTRSAGLELVQFVQDVYWKVLAGEPRGISLREQKMSKLETQWEGNAFEAGQRFFEKNTAFRERFLQRHPDIYKRQKLSREIHEWRQATLEWAKDTRKDVFYELEVAYQRMFAPGSPISSPPAYGAPAGGSPDATEVYKISPFPPQQANDRTIVEPLPLIPSAHYKLVFESGPRKGKEYTLDTKPLSIGRGPTNTIDLDDQRASRQHAELLRTSEGNYQIYDVGSANGVFVNGQRLTRGEPRLLQENEQIKIGETIFTLQRVGG